MSLPAAAAVLRFLLDQNVQDAVREFRVGLGYEVFTVRDTTGAGAPVVLPRRRLRHRRLGQRPVAGYGGLYRS